MVKRAILLMLPSLALIALVGGLIIAESGRPAAWQVELNAYLARSNTSSTGEMAVRSVARANKPWNFGPDMGYAVVGGGAWSGIDLPYPPEEVWCVLLKRGGVSTAGSGEEIPYQAVFVSFHSDRLWRQGWVVHKGLGNPFAPAFSECLSTIGCDVGLEEMGPGEIQSIVMIEVDAPRERSGRD